MTSSPPAQQPRTPWAEIAIAALPAALHAVVLLGRLHPDELFQSLEVALNRTYGFGVVPWEWQVPPNAATATQPWGIRNHAVPMLLSLLFRAGDVVGLSSVYARRILAEVPQFLLHVAMLGAVWRLLARRVNTPLAHLGLWLVALYGPLVWFAGRTMSESFSTAFLVWGLERLDADDAPRLRSGQAGPGWWAWGGALLGLAQVTRYGSAAVIIPAMLWLLVAKRFRTFAFATAGGLVIAFGLGLLDKLTWGEWFHSLIHYVRFNVVSGAAAAQFGQQPWWTYLPRLLLAPFAFVGLFFAVRRDRWLRPGVGLLLAAAVLAAIPLLLAAHFPRLVTLAPWFGLLAGCALGFLLLERDTKQPSLFIAAALGYVFILSATAHKEDRFLYPALILLSVAAAPGFVTWVGEAWSKGTARRAVVGVIAASGVAFFVFPSPYDVQRKEQFQLAARASRGVTGMVIMNEGMWGSPGYFYLGANVPWCPCDFPHDGCFQFATRDPRFNRGLYWSNGSEAEKPRDAQARAAFESAGFRFVEQRGQASLFER
ncbi:MAG: mannosyltransferase [Archangium sp.]|nr:mannosyltransferase [Archangium sp.]